MSLFLTCNGDSGTLHLTGNGGDFAGLVVLRAILNSMREITISSTERASVRTKDWAGHFPFRVLEAMAGVEALAFSIIPAEDAHLLLHWPIGDSYA